MSKNNTVDDEYLRWVLVGFLSGYTVLYMKRDTDYNRYVQISRSTGEEVGSIPVGAINLLHKRKFITASKDKSVFVLTPDGFDVAHARMKKSGAKIVSAETNVKPKASPIEIKCDVR